MLSMFRSGTPKAKADIAVQNTRFEIAWTIPRQKFLDPKLGEKAPAPWWAEETKFKSEMAAEPRYAELKKVVLRYGGGLALYEITSFRGEDELKERLVRSDGGQKAPLRKDVHPAHPGLQNALGELEAILRSRGGTKGGDKESGNADGRKARSKRSALDRLLVPLLAVEGLAVAALAAVVVLKLVPGPAVPPPRPVPPEFYVSIIVAPLDEPGMCAVTSFDNRTGRQAYLGKRNCAEAAHRNH